MTRETKVGLVIGTGIILLIGIVVSDHLASQNRGAQQTPAPPGYTDVTTGNPARAIDPRGSAADAGRNNAVVPPAQNLRTNPNGLTPGVGLNDITRDPSGAMTRDTGGITNDPRSNGAAGGNGTGNSANPADGGLARNNPLPPVDRDLENSLRNNGFLPEDNTPRLSNPTGATNARATEPFIHHVQPGESLWGIAQKFYGDGKFYTEIEKVNRESLTRSGGLREGVRLVIPNRALPAPGTNTGNTTPGNTLVDGSLNRINPDAANTNGNGNTNTDARPAGRTVKVEAGDSLSAIASKTLGSVKHMQLIIDANKDQIHDADDIKAGMILRIPEPPAAPAPAPTPDRATPPATTPRSTTPTEAPAVAGKTYKVQARDSFTSIARVRLGSEKRWKELFELNKTRVGNPDGLREGMTLVLPNDAR